MLKPENKLVLGAIVCVTGAMAVAVGIAVTMLVALLTK